MTSSPRAGRAWVARAVGEVLTPLCPRSFPGCSWAVASGDGTPIQGILGEACLEPERLPVRGDTLFDLASLTKPLATALVALDAWGRGEMDLEAPVRGASGPPFSPLDLLRHEAGFPAWWPLYGLGVEAATVRGWLLGACPRKDPRAEAEYSCLGYILLGFLLEETLGAPLPELFRRRVSGPLGIRPGEAAFCPPPEARPGIAATELFGGSEARKAEAMGYMGAEVPPDGLWGVVSDGNARFLGGAAGNAGLFATAGAALRLTRAFLPEAGFLRGPALRAAWDPGTAPRGERRSAGWKRSESPGWASGSALSAGSLGHEGYTGTGAWLDRATGSAFILLTNRIHPRHPGTDFGSVRAAFLRAALGAPTPGRTGREEPMVGPEGSAASRSGETP